MHSPIVPSQALTRVFVPRWQDTEQGLQEDQGAHFLQDASEHSEKISLLHFYKLSKMN